MCGLVRGMKDERRQRLAGIAYMMLGIASFATSAVGEEVENTKHSAGVSSALGAISSAGPGALADSRTARKSLISNTDAF